jgi:hypothetical protein
MHVFSFPNSAVGIKSIPTHYDVEKALNMVLSKHQMDTKDVYSDDSIYIKYKYR